MDTVWDMLIAHQDKNGSVEKTQYLSEHLKHTAERMRALGKEIGLESVCTLIGILHDAGKANPIWQKYIRGEVSKGGDHAGIGGCYVQYFLYVSVKKSMPSGEYKKYTKYNEFLIYPILAHHGLYDVFKEASDGSVTYWTKNRLEENKKLLLEHKELTDFIDILDRWTKDWFGQSLFQLYLKGFNEWNQWKCKLKELAQLSGRSKEAQKRAKYFYFGTAVRLLLGLLKEADVYDSANWMLEEKKPIYDDDEINAVWQRMSNKVEIMYDSFHQSPAPSLLNQVRTAMADEAYNAAAYTTQGCYQLPLPVGAGKTNTALRYALRHACMFHDQRIIYATAFLSVLEQNAKDIQDIIGRDDVIEHHSNVIIEDSEGEESEYSLAAYLRESWESPFILTTLVQLSNTLFKGESACLRRFSKLIHSVIIIDEIQSLPVTCVHLYNLMMNFLTHMMGVTIIHCTATPPGLDDTQALTYCCTYERNKNGNPIPLVPLQLIKSPVFLRTRFYSLMGENFTEMLHTEALIVHIMKQLEREKSALIIVNTKKAVRSIYDKLTEWLNEQNLPGECCYLTTNLCAAHRLERIAYMKEELKKLRNGTRQIPLICVSTNLIAAGVNVDFDVVYRSLTSLDGALQAGGRCNREGKKTQLGRVYLFLYAGESLEQIPTLQKERESSLETLRKIYGSKDADDELDVSSCLEEYFKHLYKKNAQILDYPIRDGSSAATLLQLLSDNTDVVIRYNTYAHPEYIGTEKLHKTGFLLRQSFKKAADAFQLIDTKETSVIVQYKNEDLINKVFELSGEDGRPDFMALKPVLQKLQRYTVSIYNIREYESYLQVIPKLGIYILDAEGYDKEFGLTKGDWSELIF